MDQLRDTIVQSKEAFIGLLPSLFAAIGILVLFVIIARWGRRSAKRFIKRFSKDPAVISLLSGIVWLVIVSIGILVTMDMLGLATAVTSVLAGAGILGIALGFAFQELAANLIAGVTLILQKPLKIGSLIKTNEHFGIVKKINLRMTEIETLDGQMIYVPNKILIASPLADYTTIGTRKIELRVGISYAEDLENVKKVALEALKDINNIHKGKPVEIFFEEFSEYSIKFILHLWVAFENEYDFLRARSQAVMNIKKAFKENGITIPFPIRTLDFGAKGGTRFDELDKA